MVTVGIVEKSSENLAPFFEEYLFNRVEQISFKKKKTNDLFDTLAFTRQMLEKTDETMLIVELDIEEKEENEAFLFALANMEANTGKQVFKAIFYNDEEGKPLVEEAAKQFIKTVYGVEPEE